MNNLPRLLLILAAVLALIASALILTSTTELREYIIDEEAGGYEQVRQQSWYASQGPWGVAILIIFSSLYAVPYYFHIRDRIRLRALFALLALVLTYLAGFSIGGYYLPAAGALIIAFLALGIVRLRK